MDKKNKKKQSGYMMGFVKLKCVQKWHFFYIKCLNYKNPWMIILKILIGAFHLSSVHLVYLLLITWMQQGT